MKKRKKRIYAMLLCVCMVLSLISAPVSAAETGGTAGSHEHTSECYTWTEQCTHEHTPECYSEDSISENETTPSEAEEPVLCPHICSEDSGCITKEWNCQYDSESGAPPAAVGTSQGNKTNEDEELEMEAATPSNVQKTVTVERVQAMIDALPSAEEITEDNAEDVKAQLEAIDEAKAQLSDEELDTLDFSRYIEAADALGGLSAPMLTAGGTAEVSTAADLTAALADDTNETVKLKGDVTIDATLVVNRTVTLDLNGYVLKYDSENRGSVIMVESGGTLTIADSNTAAPHYFTPDGNGLWVLGKSGGTETVAGGVITGGTGKPDDRYGDKGGGVYIGDNASLIMNGGSIVGCRVANGGAPEGGGVCLSASNAAFTMNDGAHIIGCWSNYYGGGVGAGYGEFIMNGGSIEDCTAGGATSDGNGGGVSISNNSRFIMEAGEIKRCKVTAEYARPVWGSSWGGGVSVSGTFEMKGGRITACTAEPGARGVGEGGGVTTSSYGSFIMSGNACIENCTDSTDSGVHNNGWFTIRDSAKVTNNVNNQKVINADGGTIEGEVMNKYRWSKIVGADTGSTEFQGKVTNNGSIEKGTFKSEVINNSSGTIAGGTFTGKVTNNEGTVSGGDFSSATLGGTLVITFDPNNGEPTITQNVNWSKDGAALTVPTPAPTKEGHTLEGWYYDNGGTETKWDFDTDKVKYTMTFLAQWKDKNSPATYTLSYDANGGTGAPAAESITNKNGSADFIISSAAPKREGYTFMGWADSANSAAAVYRANDPIQLPKNGNAEKTIYAVWKPGIYTVTLHANGGAIASGKDITSYTYGAGATLPAENDITREGYTFDGWYADSSFSGAPVKAISSTDTGDKTFYAKWEANTYTVTDQNDGGGGGWTESTSTAPGKDNPNTGESNPFTDVHPDDWFYNDVMFVFGNGLMSGINATSFAPYDNATRVQIAVIFYCLDGSPAVESKNDFTDVEYGPGTVRYYNAVTWAQQNGIMGGCGGGKFGPNASVTCEQLASIFYCYAKYKGCDVTVAGSLDRFTDKSDLSAWAQEAMKWAVGNGILNGRENNLLDPKGAATRAEIAAMLHRFVEKYGRKLVVTPTGTTGWTKPND